MSEVTSVLAFLAKALLGKRIAPSRVGLAAPDTRAQRGSFYPCAFGGDEGNDASGMYFIQRFCKKVIVDQKIVFVIARARTACSCRRARCRWQVKGVIRRSTCSKPSICDICLRVKLLCDPARDAVQFDSVQLGAVILLRQQP